MSTPVHDVKKKGGSKAPLFRFRFSCKIPSYMLLMISVPNWEHLTSVAPSS